MNQPEGSQNQSDVDLNITPIIDCFTVLITFMLASASFISIGFFEASTPGPGTASETVKPDLEATLRIGKNHSVELKWKGKINGRKKLDDWNEEAAKTITAELNRLKNEKLVMNQVIIQATNDTTYRDLTIAMSAVDQSGIPAVIADYEE